MADGDYFECLVWQNASGSLDIEADPQTWFAIVTVKFAALRCFGQAHADEPVPDSTDVAIPWDATVYDTASFWSASSPTRLPVPAGVKVRLKGDIDWTFGGSGYSHIWVHKNGARFFGTVKEPIRATAAFKASAPARSALRQVTVSSPSLARPPSGMLFCACAPP